MRPIKFALALGLVSAGSALFAIVFRQSLSLTYLHVFNAGNVLNAISHLPRWLIVVVPTAGGFAAGLIARFLPKRAPNVSSVMEAVALGRVRLSLRATVSRAAAAWCAIATGISIGREGPLIEVGGAIGNAVARRMAVVKDDLRALVAAGTTAGFSAAYNTPFAAVLFVLETMTGIAAPIVVLPMLMASVIAAAMTRAFVGAGPIYGQRAFVFGSAWTLILYAILGVLAAITATVFKRVLAGAEAFVQRVRIPMPWRAAAGGLIVGLIALAIPYIVGNGFEALNLVLDDRLGVSLLAFLIVAKIIATSTSVSSGIPGGIFTPVLLAGGALGALYGHGLEYLRVVNPQEAGGFALVGMAAMAAATTHAPLTAAIMVFELSGDYPVALPLMLATAVATIASRRLGERSVYYDELRARGTAWELTLDGRQLKRTTQ